MWPSQHCGQVYGLAMSHVLCACVGLGQISLAVAWNGQWAISLHPLGVLPSKGGGMAPTRREESNGIRIMIRIVKDMDFTPLNPNPNPNPKP
jgi:hypothetical protein